MFRANWSALIFRKVVQWCCWKTLKFSALWKAYNKRYSKSTATCCIWLFTRNGRISQKLVISCNFFGFMRKCRCHTHMKLNFESNGPAKKICSFIPTPVMRHQSYSFAYLPNACKKDWNWNLTKHGLSGTYFVKLSSLPTNSGDLFDYNS